MIALVAVSAASAQDRAGGMPSMTPSPLNTPPPAGPRQIEGIPAPRAPGPPTSPPLLVPFDTGSSPTARPTPRVIDVRRDSTGFIPERPPGPPPIEPPGAPTPAEKVRDLIEVVGDAQAEINVVVGRSRLIQTREPLTRIAVSNPAVADVELINDQPNTRLMNLYGRSYGMTDMTIWDATGRPTTFLVRVTIDTRDMEARLKQVFPGAEVHIRQASSQIILEGQVPDVKTMAEVLQLIAAELRGNQAAGGGGGGGGMLAGAGGGGGGGGGGGTGGGGGLGAGTTSFIINRVRVPGPRQVMLHVKIAELNRTAIRQIGVNWLDTRNRNIIGSTIGGVGSIAASTGVGQSSVFTPGIRGTGVPLPNLIQPVRTGFNAAGAAAATANSQLFGIFNAGEFSLFLNASARTAWPRSSPSRTS